MNETELLDFLEELPLANENLFVLSYLDMQGPDQIMAKKSSQLRVTYTWSSSRSQMVIDWFPEKSLVDIFVQGLGFRIEFAYRPEACSCLFMDCDGIIWPAGPEELWAVLRSIIDREESSVY